MDLMLNTAIVFPVPVVVVATMVVAAQPMHNVPQVAEVGDLPIPAE
jgi:hypothetical protein